MQIPFRARTILFVPLLFILVSCSGEDGSDGAVGPEGPPGPAGPQSWVQLYDRNYTNELTASGDYLNLSNEGVNSNYTTGGYLLTSTHMTTNDTLVFPEPGTYLVQINMKTSFLYNNAPAPTAGNSYQILFNILDANDGTLGSMVYEGMIPNDYDTSLAETTMTSSLVVSDTVSAPAIKIALANFDFNLAFENKLSVFSIVIQVQKWTK